MVPDLSPKIIAQSYNMHCFNRKLHVVVHNLQDFYEVRYTIF